MFQVGYVIWFTDYSDMVYWLQWYGLLTTVMWFTDYSDMVYWLQLYGLLTTVIWFTDYSYKLIGVEENKCN